MFWFWAGVTVIGAVLSTWAVLSLPEGTNMLPIPPKVKVSKGPYRFMEHPMYLGNILGIGGLGGMAAGIVNAIALAALTELLMRYWKMLEERDP